LGDSGQGHEMGTDGLFATLPSKSNGIAAITLIQSDIFQTNTGFPTS
jgi:hypothetical protein